MFTIKKKNNNDNSCQSLRILLIKYGAIGDILEATPLIRQLKQSLSSCELHFLVASSFAPVLSDNPYIDQIITFANELFSIKRLLQMVKGLLKLRPRHYDYVFVLDKHYYYAFLSFVVSAGKRIGFLRDDLSRLFLQKMVVYNDIGRYHALYYLDLLTSSGLANANHEDIALDFIIPDSAKLVVNAWLTQGNISSRRFIVVVNSGGANEGETTRRLPITKIIELLTAVSNKYNLPVLLLGGANDAINYAQYIELLNTPRVLSVAGKFTLAQSAYLLLQAHRIFTTDCGLLHVAVSQGLHERLVCFFGPTAPSHVLPPDSRIRVYWADGDIYSQDYPLYGKVHHTQDYFMRLNMHEIVRQVN